MFPISGFRFLILSFLVLLGAGCNRSAQYSGVGDVVDIDEARTVVTIRHDAIEGLDAGTTRCAAAPETLAGVAGGMRVRFEISGRPGECRALRVTALSAGVPGMHDHTPHHGGVVAMVGLIHLEALAHRDGHLQIYVTDLWRRPLPLEQVQGSVTLNLSGDRRTLPLTAGSEALEASGPQLDRSEVYAHFALTNAGQPVDMTFALPLAAGAAAGAGIQPEGCVAPSSEASAGRRPRCVIALGGAVSALAASPDGQTVVIAVADLGVSAWRMPAGELLRTFASPPPIVVPIDEPPHAEAPNAIAISWDGTEAVVALENRLLHYAMGDGHLIGAVPNPRGVVRDVAWAPADDAVIVSSFYDRAARALHLDDGAERDSIAVEREAAAVASTRDCVAVSSEAGPIALRGPGMSEHLLGPSGHGPARGLAFAGDRLVSASDDGVVRVWEIATGALVDEFATGALLTRVAAAPDGRRIAAAGISSAVYVYDLQQMTLVDTLQWHRAQILGLAWAGSVLISADVKGQVALWEVGGQRDEVPTVAGRE